MKFWNLTATTGADGAKALTIEIFGTIEPGFFDDGGVKSAEIAAQLAEHQDAKSIAARINSRGGDPFAGVAIYNLLRNHPAAQAGNLTTTVEGLAASAASIIAMAGKTVMQRGAMLMIHNPWTVAIGDANELRATADTLDAVRDSLLSVYRAKTGKKPAELRALLDAETWFGAEDAKRHGFADEVSDAAVKARAEGDTVVLNSIAFARAGLPAPILAMATEVPPPAEPAITRETLQAKAPALLAALLAEGEVAGFDKGKAAGVAEERARMKAIDELPIAGHADLVAAAKYGDPPQTAAELALGVVKAGQQATADRLAARRTESAPAEGIGPGTPESAQQAELAAAKQIAEFANRRRGGR